jgi:serine/threonine-protein kinase
VYNAYDSVTRRRVALKTLRGTADAAALELFAKEWTVLARLSHPNIVDILDTGQFADRGEPIPFFVMPLLPGVTLDALIRGASPRLTAERVVEIVVQTCRGLQAAHEKGLIHRDLKPSNIFVMEDDSVKIIDFGVVHLTGIGSVTGLKGTLPYMAPEQVEMKPATPAADIYSLGVVCYEALTGKKPFARGSDIETIQALRQFIPPAASEINTSVSRLLSRVVHKAMAKQPAYRFASAREFADALQKAVRNEPIEGFDRARIASRLERVKKACQSADFQFGSEVLTELEAEGHIDPDMNLLRVQIDHALRQKSIRQLLDSARTRLDEEEFPLALQKVQEVLEMDPENREAILLRRDVEKRRGERQIANWSQLVDEHMADQMYAQARQALHEILKIAPADTRAAARLTDVDRREQEFIANRNRKEQLYQDAMQAYQAGEISSALSKLERILELSRSAPGSGAAEREAQYQSFYNQLRSERDLYRNAYSEGQRQLAERNFAAALELCARILEQYPGDPLFQALQLEVQEQRRQEQSGFVAETNRRVEAEADLDRKFAILQEAAARFPDEPYFQQSIRLIRERRDLVNGIVAKARQYEDRGLYADAMGQWDILRNIYGQYPGLDFEVQRLKRRREVQVREEAKTRWVEQIDHHLEVGDCARALEVTRNALAEFPDDRELTGLERLARQGIERSAEARRQLAEGQRLCGEGQAEQGLEALGKAKELDEKNPAIRAALLNALVERARSLMERDWRAATGLIEQALELDRNHPGAKSLRALADDYARQEAVEELVCVARDLQAKGEVEAALDRVEQGLASFPHDLRLAQLRATLRNALPEPRRADVRRQQEMRPAAGAVPSSDAEPTKPLGVRHPEEFCASAFGTTSVDTKTFHAAPAPAQASVETVQTLPAPALAAASFWVRVDGLLRRQWSKMAPYLRKAVQATSKGSVLQWVVVGISAVLLVWAYFVTRKPAPVPVAAPREFAVEFRPNVEHASFLLDGRPVTGAVKLRKGTHYIKASADGYRTESREFVLDDGSKSPYLLEFQFVPEPVRLQLASDLGAGMVALDNQEPVTLQEGGFVRDDLGTSPHTLKLMDGGRELLSMAFQIAPGEPARVNGIIETKGVAAVVVASLGDRARVYASGTVAATPKGQPRQPIPAGGLMLEGLSPATAEVMIEDGKANRPFPITIDSLPHLNLWVNSDRNVGFLTVRANVPDAQVFLDGKPARRPNLKSGNLTLSLAPKVYKVRIAAPQFEDAPEQSVEVRKGEPQELKFDLKPLVTTAALEIEGATPDAEVWLDNARAGSVNAGGAWRQENIAPGSHSIQLRKQDFEAVEVTRAFAAKQTVRLTAAEATLRPFGRMTFRVSPPTAALTFRPLGEGAGRPVRNGDMVSVKAGSYEVEAKVENGSSQSRTYIVSPGGSVVAELSVAAIRKGVPEARPVRDESPFDPSIWTVADGGWMHSGSGYGWLRANRGTFDVELLRASGKKRRKKFEWVVDYKDEENQIAYTLDGSNFSRRAIAGGRTHGENKLKVDASSDVVRFRIEIAPDRVAVRGAGGAVLDVFPRAAGSGEPGRFGFKGDVDVKVTVR